MAQLAAVAARSAHGTRSSRPLRDQPDVAARSRGEEISGGIIASLSIPWGDTMGDEDLGGYHLVWPRDLVEAGSALIAAGARDAARRVLHYLEATQEPDGHWPQNMWVM